MLTTTNLRIGKAAVLIMLFTQLFFSCSVDRTEQLENTILEYTDGIKIVNTHEHQRGPDQRESDSINFYHLLQTTYLMQDLGSAGAQWVDYEVMKEKSNSWLWEQFAPYLDYCRSTSYYSHFVEGFKKLYGFKDLYFTEENIGELSAQVAANYSDFEAWYSKAFSLAGYEIMFNDQYWNPYNVDVDSRYHALVFHINNIVDGIWKRPRPGWIGEVYKKAEEEGFTINKLEDYLDYCDHLFKKNLDKNAVCLKNSMAYSRSIYYEDIDYETAEAIFERAAEGLMREDQQRLEDFMFHWCIGKAIEHDLPIQIHTGYLAGNGNNLENGKPAKLLNLFMKYPEAKFVLFHGGYPWTSEYVALGKMFPNVYLDLVWLPQISREKAVRTFDEMLDGVPYSKIFWGGDCAVIEESVGSLEFAKGVIAEVLAMRIDRGLLTEDIALEIVEAIFRENAIRVFRLDEKLGIIF